MRRLTLFVCMTTAVGLVPAASDAPRSEKVRKRAQTILADKRLPAVLEKGKALLKTGLNAGSGYGEVWIRDLNTFIEISLQVNDPHFLRGALLTFFKFRGPEGDIVDGYIPKARGGGGYKYRRSPLAPELLAHKNTVETDQEASLVQAVRKYVMATKDRGFLDERVDGQTVRERLARALTYVLEHRFDRKYGLVWGATTADWGDVQPEHSWGVELDENSHRAIDIYDNAMVVVAVNDYLELVGAAAPETARWQKVRDDLRRAVRTHLWDKKRRQFIPHLYLEGSPFPKDFDEAAVYYHGGTAVAIEAGLLSRDEVKESLARMVDNVKRAGAGTIGLTLYPVYPQGFFRNRSMGPFSYQNGGDWTWFGGRMIQQLIRYGLIEEAYRELTPMVARVLEHDGFHEWWSRENKPRGSGKFRGSAGVLGVAIQQLLAWANDNRAQPSTAFRPGGQRPCCRATCDRLGPAACRRPTPVLLVPATSDTFRS